MLIKNKLTQILTILVSIILIINFISILQSLNFQAEAAKDELDQDAHTTFKVKNNSTASPTGLSPAQIKAVYNLPASGGSGTIAIIDAFDNPGALSDLNVFSSTYGLPQCNNTNPCFEKVVVGSRKAKVDQGWAMESSLDVQWAHAIAPNAKILLVESPTNSLSDLLKAVDYARNRSDVVSVSMSWGANEFSSEANYDYHFTGSYGATFFASSGDNGNGVSWPAVSANVTSIGGTSLAFNSDGSLQSETAWNGSGGGRSAYENEPSYQSNYNVSNANGKRAVPDVAYDADPNSGFSVYDTTQSKPGWVTVGGTSAGAPQWAGIRALGLVNNSKLYTDAQSSYNAHFRDITLGTNGSCGYFCTTTSNYDYVTGLGSPVTSSF